MATRKPREAAESSREALISLTPLAERLGTISKSLGVLALRLSPTRPKNSRERAHCLRGLGFDRNEIAGILGTTPETVSARLSEKKRRRRRR